MRVAMTSPTWWMQLAIGWTRNTHHHWTRATAVTVVSIIQSLACCSVQFEMTGMMQGIRLLSSLLSSVLTCCQHAWQASRCTSRLWLHHRLLYPSLLSWFQGFSAGGWERFLYSLRFACETCLSHIWLINSRHSSIFSHRHHLLTMCPFKTVMTGRVMQRKVRQPPRRCIW